MLVEHGGEYPSQWAAICSIAEKFGMTAQTLRSLVRQAEIDVGKRPGVTSVEAQRIKELEARPGSCAGPRDPQGGVGSLCARARPASARR